MHFKTRTHPTYFKHVSLKTLTPTFSREANSASFSQTYARTRQSAMMITIRHEMLSLNILSTLF